LPPASPCKDPSHGFVRAGGVFTLQRLRRHRPTEIEYLNGEIVGLGAKVGVPTPLNAAVIAMVHHVEQYGQFWKMSAIREAISTDGRNLQS
jgi:2-dehydropantoate 2-reductase